MSRSLTVEEKRDLVAAFLLVPWGQRMQWLQERGVRPSEFYGWRKAVVAGELERGLIPRGGVWVSSAENREMARLHAENEKLRVQLRRTQAERQALSTALEVMGKAIEHLQDETASKCSQDSPGRR